MKTVIITPSYAPDYDRCRALVESIKRYVTGYSKHLIVVDRADQDLFSGLIGDGCELVIKEDILPHWIKPIPFSKKWWFNGFAFPVRGWILQQIVKLSTAEWCHADRYMFIDSDVLFVRNYDVATSQREGKTRLYSGQRKDVDYEEKRHINWYQCAAKLFGLSGSDHIHREYISQLNTWNRSTLLAMYRKIEETTGKDWKKVMCNTLDFSEYILYGVFVESVKGITESNHYQDEEEICHCSWHHTIDSAESLESFMSEIKPTQSSILIQSNLNIDTSKYLPST